MERLFDIDDEADFELTLEEELFEGSAPRTQLIPEKRLSSPITDGLTRRISKYCEDACSLENLTMTHPYEASKRADACLTYLKQNPQLSFSSISKPLTEYAKILSLCKSPPELITPELYPALFRQGLYKLPRLTDDYSLARELYAAELDCYLTFMSDICKPAEVKRIKAQLSVPKYLSADLSNLAASAKLWNDITETYRKHYGKTFKVVKHTIGPVRFACGSGFLILRTDDIGWQLLTYEQLQMLQDATQARYNTYAALHIGFHNGTNQLTTYVDMLLHWQESCLTRYGNDGYELIKAPEALFKTRLNTLTGGDVLEYSSYDRTLDKLTQKELKLATDPIMTRRLHYIVRQVTDLSDCAELFGLIKLSGHPVVYAEKSAASVRKEALPVGTQNIYSIRQVRRMMTHIVLSGYINKHGSWPPMLCLPPRGSELRRHFNNRVTELPLSCYNLADNDGVVFDKFIEFDYSTDYLKFLDDKAICPGAKECGKFWFGNSDQRERRLLTKILDLPHFDTKANVERLRRRKFEKDEMIVELTQKERELKNAARCFCKLPIAVRTFFTLTEYNLGEYFMRPYMPQQTMTMSSAETKSRMYHMTRTSRHRKTVLVESDFSRWNLCMRDSTVSAVTDILEQIFGLPGVFSQAHWFFSHATIVLTDKHSLPAGAKRDVPITEWPESDLLWRNHRGGFEGIIQKIWTIFTICMVMLVLYDKDVSFLMAGQGDNQVFALQFDDTNTDLRTQLTKVLADMRVRCRYLNHDVKPEECIDSLTVLTYSKEIYVEGVHILYNLKFASRTMSVSDSDVPSLSKEIAAINATAIACADSCKFSFKAVFWRTWHTLQHLTMRRTSVVYENEWPVLNRIRDNREMAKFVLTLPGSLGGLPIQSWGRFFLKGEVDDLAWDVSAMKRLAVNDRVISNDLNELLSGAYSVKSPDLTQLILDPTSIPIKRPKDQTRLIKELVESRLPGITHNKWIHSILSQQTTDSGRRLLGALANTSPLYPKIMSDIYDSSIAGVRDTLVGRFTMTRTIVSVTGSSNFTREIVHGNIRLLENILVRYDKAVNLRGHHRHHSSAFEICGKLRALWGPSVKNSNVGVYCPLDWQLTTDLSSTNTISASTRSPVKDILSTVGAYPPNFGTNTRQKLSQHGYKIIMSSGTLQDLKRLVVTASELKAEDAFSELIDDIIRSRSPFSLATLSTVFPTSYGGTAAHRHDQINSSNFSILGSKTVPTHLNFCSDHAGELSGGELDYPVVFQEFYLFLTHLFQTISVTLALDSSMAFGLVVPPGLCGIDDDKVKLVSESTTPIPWPFLPGNKLCYEDTLSFNEIPLEPPKALVPHYTADEIHPVSSIFNLLLSSTPVKMITSLTASQVILPIELIDLKEFNHAEVSDIITASSWYVLTAALYAVIKVNPKDAHVFFDLNLINIARFVAGKLARLFLHVSNSSSRFCQVNNIMLEPGIFGALQSGLNLGGIIVQRARDALRSRELLTDGRYKCLFFKDTAAKYNSLSLMCATALVASASFDHSKLLVTSYQRKILEIAYIQAELTRPNAAGPKIIENACVEALKASKHSEMFAPVVRRWLGYLYTTAAELVRTIRARPKVERIRSSNMLSASWQPRRTPRNGRVSWKNTGEYSGHVPLQHICDSDRTAAAHFADRLLRPVGRFASALSIWLRFIADSKIKMHGLTVLSIGVGHGAVAAAAYYHGASSILGIDLLSSFPMITQREGTYKPHEITAIGAAEAFKWHQHTFSQGGDVFTLDFNTISPDVLTVIDIEVPFHRLAKLLESLPPQRKVVLRFAACEDCLKWFLANLHVHKLFCYSATRQSTCSYIAIFEKDFVQLEGSVNNITDLAIRPVRSCFERSLALATQRVMDLVLPYGLSTDEATLPELRRLADELERLYHVDANDTTRARTENLMNDLRLMEAMTKDSTLITPERIAGMSRVTLSRVSSYLSCTLPNVNEIVDGLADLI